MKFAMIGLGKMGKNLVKNAVDHDIEVVAYDLNRTARQEMAAYSSKITPVDTLEQLLTELSVNSELERSQRIVWVMVPAGTPTNSTIATLSNMLSAGDILIDGGTSGGMSGARHGGNFMIGGDKETWPKIEPLFEALAQKNGYLYTGPLGSGHYLKMIHNGIEYGMMQAIAEGFEILEASPYDYDYEAVAKLWNNGSVIRSWLMELAEEQFAKDPKLDEILGQVQASGEGKWTVEESLDLEVPAPIIALSLMMRNRSLQSDTMTGKVVAALRNGFGGHDLAHK